MEITELLTKLQAAFKDVQAKSDTRDKASNALAAADQAWRASADTLAALRDESASLIGALLPAADPRFRKSA